ncbi:glycosyl hydrolase [Granulicella tundricola]|uniref:Beta-galactosidase trimerisation domain protein n=1 Tax=Granulicella tundricola (strain ATCC BAA-1859 / DSM 23138 / MP5ACTX9) TaxID=1198114 RepID=E8X685_GRATM|nr:glycosyl hydrolase [Granulicella tundricola]ADW70969.1 Beta-galactosidase trimerisation domain protein [Granulicella tundricola MP5ACTX9]
MKTILAGMMMSLACCVSAQQPWQKIQMVSADEVKKGWVAPAAEYGPEPYYGLNGAVDASVYERDLDTMKRLGYGAVTVQAGYGMTQAYLSPEYMGFFREFVLAAKKRDMRVWIVDDAGYPSGFAGGKFTELHPELRMQGLAVAAKYPAQGGETVKQAVGAGTVSVTAIDTDGKTVPVPVTNAGIAWTAPAGSWTVMVVEHRFMTSPTRSDTNPKRVKDGSQSLEDYMDPAATAVYLAFTHEAYKKAIGDEFGKTVMGFRGDEPDYSIGGLPWTPKFFDHFMAVKGYDVRPYVASFLIPMAKETRDAKLTEVQKRARADYYDVISQMFRDGFFKPQGDWCAANHLEYQVHLNHEEMEMQLVKSEGEFFRDMKYVQVPGIDSIWHQIWTDTVSDFPRLASSASHVYGHPRAFTESFAAYRPEPDVTMARYILNEQFVRGVNLVETMYFPASTGGKGGPAKYMQDPAYPALLQYVRRMSYVMSMGRPDATVGLYLPSSSMWMGDASSDAMFVSTERLLSEHQIDFDIVSEDALGGELKVDGAAFVTASGNRLRTVVVPGASVLSEAVVARLKKFAAAGGHVLFLGRTPGLVFGRTLLDARAAKTDEFAWAKSVTDVQLPETPTPPAYPPTVAPTELLAAPTIVRALSAVTGFEEMKLAHEDSALRYTHRRLKDAEVYLFFNEGADAKTDTVMLQGSGGKKIEAWDAETGTVRAVVAKKMDGGVSVPLDLKGYETRILVVR